MHCHYTFFYFIFFFFLIFVFSSCFIFLRSQGTLKAHKIVERKIVTWCVYAPLSLSFSLSVCVYVCDQHSLYGTEKDNQPALQTRCITKTKQYFSLFSLAKINQIGHFLILYLCISITSIYLASCAHWFCCWYFSSLCLILKTVSFGNCCCCLFLNMQPTKRLKTVNRIYIGTSNWPKAKFENVFAKMVCVWVFLLAPKMRNRSSLLIDVLIQCASNSLGTRTFSAMPIATLDTFVQCSTL